MSGCGGWFYDHLDAGDEGCLSDAEHDQALKRRREAKAGAWRELRAAVQGTSTRHFLDGQPINCGRSIELQSIEYRSDDFGEFLAYLDQGVAARYEVQHTPAGIRPMLHVIVHGHEFTAAVESWMRFRWPVKR